MPKSSSSSASSAALPTLKRARVRRAVRGIVGKTRFGEQAQHYLTGVLTEVTRYILEGVEQIIPDDRKTITVADVAASMEADGSVFIALPEFTVTGPHCAPASLRNRYTATGKVASHAAMRQDWLRQCNSMKAKLAASRAARAARQATAH